ncbi:MULTISPECIES: YraN family protein [Gulosibacter]|uniref:YraN family protein n=1 Tax=Gulosibacter TaxID=256818 RepID=UPI000F630000|nr:MULTISPECIES: YraN family protein [Gulosibacter]
MARHITLGREGEDLAVKYLADAGFEIIDRNWRCSAGEVDIVARGEGYLVFIEVKTRSSIGSGHPLDAITPTKIARMTRVAYRWLDEHPGPFVPIRLDVVSIVMPRFASSSLLHVEGVGE